MRALLSILRFPRGSDRRLYPLHVLWLWLTLTAAGLCTGVLALKLAAASYSAMDAHKLFDFYLSQPQLMLLNLLPPVLLMFLFYYITRQPWLGFLGGYAVSIGVALVNYYKIRLRSDPLLAADLRLVSEAKGIVGGYTLEITPLVKLCGLCLLIGLVCFLLFTGGGVRGWTHLLGALSSLAIFAVACVCLFLNAAVYQGLPLPEEVNPWSDTEVFVSRGCLYPFLYSARDMLPSVPEGYHEAEAAELLAEYPDADLPAGQDVSVMGIMLEAFCDLTDFAPVAENPSAAHIYDAWHKLERQSVSGDLLTNIFAGGTVDSEWGFLTGYAKHDEFRSTTDSYVWYFRNQGYQTLFSHPGWSWFYNRQNVCEYLGFQQSWFTENHYGKLVDPTNAIWHSDDILVQELLNQLKARMEDGPVFSFAVSYQNHGPYDPNVTTTVEHFTPANSGMTAESCNILNNYLNGVDSTIQAMVSLTRGLEQLDRPVVLVLFGDHKPWGGNGNSAYTELGLDFDLSTQQGFQDYYSTPYLIWANSAAKKTLGNDFTGDGGSFSPCFLMTELFDQCGWQGPGFLQLSREMRAATPLVHERGLYWPASGLTDALPPEDTQLLHRYLCAAYYRETKIDPRGE